MKDKVKSMARPYATLFCLALVIAVIARIGLAVMDATGTLAYDYISASGVALLDVVCSILTGSAFVAFLFAAGLVLTLSTAGVALYGLLYERGAAGAGKPLTAFLWGWATAFVAIVCLLVVVSGILSAVQVASMSSKLPSLPVLGGALVVFAAFIGTLLAAASLVVCACIERARGGARLEVGLIVAAAVCGLVVMALTVGTVSAINTVAIDKAAVLGWFAADVAVNLALMGGATALIKRFRAASAPC